MALSSKARDGSLIVIDSLDVAEGKTRALVASLAKLNLTKALFIDGDAVNVSFAKASANIIGVHLLPAVGANVYDILKADSLVLTRAAVEKLEARFNG
jgi:large subunit ribosomal protein L4